MANLQENVGEGVSLFLSSPDKGGVWVSQIHQVWSQVEGGGGIEFFIAGIWV